MLKENISSVSDYIETNFSIKLFQQNYLSHFFIHNYSQNQKEYQVFMQQTTK